MVIVETVLTGLVDEFPRLGLNACVRILTATTVAVLFMLIGLPMTTQVQVKLHELRKNKPIKYKYHVHKKYQ